VTTPHLPPLPVPRLVLWRHGRTEWNATGRFQGQMDAPLDDRGREQALRSAPLVAAGLPAEGTLVVSSDLSRASETADAVAAVLGVPVLLEPRLREHGLGCWEGLTRAEVADRFPEQYADWTAGRPVSDRGGEEPAAVGERAVAALADLPPAEAAVVVTHGGTAGRLLERLLGLREDQRRMFGSLANCAWSELVQQDGRWRLVRHNASVLPVADRRVEGVPGTVPLHAAPSATDRGSDADDSGPAAAGDAEAAL
jgi:glucosyl-3-phosphoglycerate phosphatase